MSQVRFGATVLLAVSLLSLASSANAEFRVKWSYSGSRLASTVAANAMSDGVCDLNGGAAEVIGINDARTGIGIHDGATGAVLFSSPSFSGNIVQVACADIDGDGFADVILSYTNPAGVQVIGWHGTGVDITAPDQGAEPVAPDLRQNGPNPFDTETHIAFALANPGLVDVSIYDVSGRRVRRLVNRRFEAGQFARTWDGSDDQGIQLASGTYFYLLTVDGVEVQSRKAIRLR